MFGITNQTKTGSWKLFLRNKLWLGQTDKSQNIFLLEFQMQSWQLMYNVHPIPIAILNEHNESFNGMKNIRFALSFDSITMHHAMLM